MGRQKGGDGKGQMDRRVGGNERKVKRQGQLRGTKKGRTERFKEHGRESGSGRV